jgi:hypothetical protein
MDRWAVDIDRDDITKAVLVAEREAVLPAGAIEVAIDLFAMTANNVTYAALGKPTGLLGPDAGYWDFFAERDQPGRLPVWGFATVTRSHAPDMQIGEVLYGYWPMASHAILLPERVGAGGFVDATPRRHHLPALYNRYQRLASLQDFDQEDRSYWPVFRPLYLTGWLVADQLADARDHEAEQVLVTAASSKTALGFAHAMRERDERPDLVALTSARNHDFVKATKLYDRVLLYADVAMLDAEMSTALIDFAGDAGVTRAIHHHFGDRLALSMIVGVTHWDAPRDGSAMPGPRPTGFFAPARMEKRTAEWGPGALRDRIAAGWGRFMADVRGLTQIDARQGADDALAAYLEAVAGRADPRRSVVVGQ